MIYGFFPLTLEPKTFVYLENYPNTPPLPWWPPARKSLWLGEERAGVRGRIRLGHFHGLRLPAVGRGDALVMTNWLENKVVNPKKM